MDFWINTSRDEEVTIAIKLILRSMKILILRKKDRRKMKRVKTRKIKVKTLKKKVKIKMMKVRRVRIKSRKNCHKTKSRLRYPKTTI